MLLIQYLANTSAIRIVYHFQFARSIGFNIKSVMDLSFLLEKNIAMILFIMILANL